MSVKPIASLNDPSVVFWRFVTTLTARKKMVGRGTKRQAKDGRHSEIVYDLVGRNLAAVPFALFVMAQVIQLG